MKILVAGPGTGKTVGIDRIISDNGGGSRFLILSFTNATVNDLQKKLTKQKITSKNCMTLHKFAMKYNHDKTRHLLLPKEVDELKTISKGTGIDFGNLCDFLACTTFDQMIERFIEYAKINPLYLKEKLSDYDALIVDEYQDFSTHEQALIDILVENIQDSYILGDDDQCIYDGFKDTTSEKLIFLYQDDLNEKIPHEHICYRCPDKVVEHATCLITNNRKRIQKEWKKSGKLGKIEYSQLETFDEVANAIYEKVKDITVESVLILAPVKFAAEPIMKKLQENNVEFSNYFAERISQILITKSWEIKSIFGKYKYTNLIFLGYSKLSNRKKFYGLIKNHFDTGQKYEEMYNSLLRFLPDQIKDTTLDLETLLSQDCFCDILDLYQKADGDNCDDKLENIFKNGEEESDKDIKVMSIHKSKGLGADHVFIVGLNEGILPNKKDGNDKIESQRRLLYVGMTRTQKQLYLFSSIYIPGNLTNKVNACDFKYDYKRKTMRGRASSFLSELKLP